MRLNRRSAVLAIALFVTALGAGQALAARGGLSVTPGILEAAAQPGSVGGLKIANTTRRPMRVRVAVRPWRQARNGAVTPDRRRVLTGLRPSRRTFGLAAGATKAIQLSLAGHPAGGSLYGAVETTGAPRGRGKGIKVAYRLVTSLRLFPPAPARRYRARPIRLFEHGTTRRGALFLAVKNGGNTIDPIGGKVQISGRGHSLSGVIAPQTILPGATVNLRLARLHGGLPRGRYRVGVVLTQASHRVGALRKAVRLR